jgi:copper transport outer membrane protein MctB
MFDYRYHAQSLAAVLIALALGVLIGIAIGDSNLVSSAQNGLVSTLRSNLESSREQVATLKSERALESTFQTGLYELAVHDLLSTRKVGLVFLGGSSERVDTLVRDTVTQAGGELSSVTAIAEPLVLAKLGSAASGTRYQALSQVPEPPGLIKEFGIRMGHQLVKGGRLLTRVASSLLSSSNGQFGELEGLVVARQDTSGMPPEQAKVTGEFESGLIIGAKAAGAATVGVELSNTAPSQVPWYKAQGISSVDDLDKVVGNAALALALAGSPGSWGIKSTADAPLPRATGATARP